MTRITLDELMTRLSDLSLNESDLAPYFEIDPDAEDAFAPAFRLNPGTVRLPPGPEGAARSAMALNLANWWCRMQRQARFIERMKQGYSGPVIVAEGDSWWQYPLLLQDTIDHLMQSHAVWCVSAAGDLLGDMAAKAEYVAALQSTNAGILLFSGGGNDLLAGGNLAQHLERFDAALKPADYLLPSFDQVLARAFADYERILRDVHGRFPSVQVLMHGYDYALPNNGRWLGKPMASRGINDRALQAGIAAEIMDRFNRGLRRLAATMPHVTYLDLRGKVGAARWHDELHPTSEGYGAVAEVFRLKIAEIANAPRAPRVFALGGPFGTPAVLERRMRGAAPAEQPPAPGSRAVSLHLGLNFVDPGHYAGWDGALTGCENDALAMERLARSLGYETRVMLTDAATRQGVVDIIAGHARTLQAGDMFLLTVAGHGGRIPDWNRDEPDDGTRTAMDSTLCLFDSQLVDDELFHLWSGFAEGVRIVMVGDTCHSGTQVRVNPQSAGIVPGDGALRPRFMPPAVALRTWQQNLDAYRSRTSSLDRIDRRILLDPLSKVVKADILGLGACQDHQYAYDGGEHGVFTAALLRVWDEGRFAGDYHSLMATIDREIGMTQQVPKLDLQLMRDPGFALQVPFAPWPNRRPEPGANLPALSATTPFAGPPALG